MLPLHERHICDSCYAGSLAPVFYILLVELFSEGVRPLAAGVATGVTFATGALTDSIFLSLCGVSVLIVVVVAIVVVVVVISTGSIFLSLCGVSAQAANRALALLSPSRPPRDPNLAGGRL